MIEAHCFPQPSSFVCGNRQHGILDCPCSPSLGWSALFHNYSTILRHCPFAITFAKTLRLHAGLDPQVYGYNCSSSANSRKLSAFDYYLAWDVSHLIQYIYYIILPLDLWNNNNRELFDTFFIVIHKKPLIFLHWYHHVTVLLYCWHAYVNKSPYGLFFVTMNYGVHAIMYGYYFLMAIKMKPKWLNAMFITGAQISQMIVGVIVTVFAFYFYQTENDDSNPCHIQKVNNIAAFIMYGSYLFLFMQFFTLRYQPRSRKPIKKID